MIEKFKVWYKFKKLKRSIELLVDLVGEDMLLNSMEKVRRAEAYYFCQQYAKERAWCKKNKLDVKVLEEEKKFLENLKEFNFDSHRFIELMNKQLKEMLENRLRRIQDSHNPKGRIATQILQPHRVEEEKKEERKVESKEENKEEKKEEK
jgi:hypothetical protein